MNGNKQTLLTIAVFILLFISIGWAAPILYIDVAPENQFIEMHSFEVSDTHINANSHNICMNRTVHRPSSADITVEIILLQDDGSIVEQDSFEVDAYYQKGSEEIIIPREIRTDSLETGTYQYIQSAELEYYNGRAEKQLTFESEKFTVYGSQDALENATNTSC